MAPVKEKKRFRLRKKILPFPVLIFLLPAYFEFLFGSDDVFWGMMFMISLFLVGWYFLGPDLEAPSSPVVARGRLVDPSSQPPMDANGAMQTVQLRLWSERVYEDAVFRRKALAFVLAGLLIGTGAYTYFEEDVVRSRANWIIALCALGLLALAILALIRLVKRGKEKTDRAAYPQPMVNMTYDHEAAADSRVRALQQRLERLEDWKKSGLIDEKEYGELRKKYLGQ